VDFKTNASNSLRQSVKLSRLHHSMPERKGQIALDVIFVTVGTTEFNELIDFLDNSAFVDLALSLRCGTLTLQIGRGNFPLNLPELCAAAGIQYDCFRFKADLRKEMAKSHLILSHCGAGSILEAMDLRKPLIVVVNSTLQGDHQRELSDALALSNHCLTTTISTLFGCLSGIISGVTSLESFANPFPDADLDLFPAAIDDMFDL
jgi:beta-1,4-N-acetylglucosaminyltransferase